MITLMYKAHNFGVEEIEVERYTDKSYWVDGLRYAREIIKNTPQGVYWEAVLDSRMAAVSFARVRKEYQIKELELQIRVLRGQIREL